MLPKSLFKDFDKARLRGLLAFFFFALALPTAAVIWQAYGQLKWEAFHQYRGVAEELTNRIDARLIDMIDTADARSFADYTFLVITGDPSANFLQRSPLSAYPVSEGLPGTLGYFQVDSAGAFSTPALPPATVAPEKLGIGADEYASRLTLAQEIQAVLADNRLVQSRPDIGLRRDLLMSPESPMAELEELKTEYYEPQQASERQRMTEAEPAISRALASSAAEGQVVDGLVNESAGEKDAIDKLASKPLEQAAHSKEGYSQQIFDQLNQAPDNAQESAGIAGAVDLDDAPGTTKETRQRFITSGKVADLKLDAAYQKKSEILEREEIDAQSRDSGRAYAPARVKRREQIALPEAIVSADSQAAANGNRASDLRISTFESEIDPLEFSLLDSGHFVLFRKVWRDGERYIQGLLIDQPALVEDIIEAPFVETALWDMSSLIVAYHDDVIHTIRVRDGKSYTNGNKALDGALLYRNRLSAPLDSLELIYSIKRQPPGPGASVLGWVTLVLALVFLGGFYALYRLGLSQIRLARQQQDFVSAVSHELKTPLTSIRMYGEMLKEGWADEEKRQTYYEFIHDESERLTRLISNVLQLARITRNEPQFDLRPTRVGELMGNIESKIANQVERAGFALKFVRDEEADNSVIHIDDDCFAQIVINLVDNAIKFSRDAENKTIEISSNLTSDRRVIFAVRDYGPGIPRAQIKKIFELFYRSENELTRETVGTGIGLTIVHQLALAMGGKVDVINQQPGAEFRVSFNSSEHQ